MKIKNHLNFTSLRKKASEVFESIPDWRQKSKTTISIHDAMMSGFACMYFQDSSLLQFQKRMQEDQQQNNLNTLFEVENITDRQYQACREKFGSKKHFVGKIANLKGKPQRNGYL